MTDSEKTDRGGDGEGFVQRWARLKDESRKLEAREGGRSGAPPPPADAPAPISAPAPTPVATPGAAPVGVPAELPSLDSLTNESDYSPFLRPGVPDVLRRQALRRLWACDPASLLPEPLDAHNIDYNAVPIFLDGLKSAYQAGRGFVDPEPAGKQVLSGDPAQPEDKVVAAAPAPPQVESPPEPPPATPLVEPDKSA